MNAARKNSLLANWRRALCLSLVLCAVVSFAVVDHSWVDHVSDADRKRVNPYAGQGEAIAAGSKMFADHCAKCHGPDALGNRKKPSLRTNEVQSATDGELFWLLKNGFLRRGMPTWNSIPEPSRWQLVAYVKSLGVSSENHSSNLPQEDLQEKQK
jgi:mono/diheme cytochrome c family protein